MNALQNHLQNALKQCGETRWQPEPVYDHNEQSFCLDTIKDQVGEYVREGEALAKIRITGWCLSGKMPRSQGLAVFFTRIAIEDALRREFHVLPGDVVDLDPPWTVKQTNIFLKNFIDPWFRWHWKEWADSMAQDAYDFQESMWNSVRRYD